MTSLYFGRTWQDWTFALGNIVLSAGMVPALFDAQKPPLQTAGVIIPVLLLFAAAEWTMDLKASTVSTMAQVTMWATLGVQRGLQ